MEVLGMLSKGIATTATHLQVWCPKSPLLLGQTATVPKRKMAFKTFGERFWPTSSSFEKLPSTLERAGAGPFRNPFSSKGLLVDFPGYVEVFQNRAGNVLMER